MKVKFHRLRLLGWYLRSVPQEFFNLISWLERNGYELLDGMLPTIDCGTSGCAIGWAGHVPEFRKLGFRLVEREFSGTIVPSYNGVTNWDAVEQFFGLSESDAQFLFSMYRYPSNKRADPIYVAKRIELFCNEHEA